MSLSPEIRKRLHELNRGPLTFRKGGAADGPESPREQPQEPPAKQAPDARPMTLEEAARGEVVASPFGSAYLITKSLKQMLPDGGGFVEEYGRVFRDGSMAWREGSLHPELRPLLEIDPQRVVFLDIETTALSAQPIFLIGVMHYGSGDFHIHQIFARDYSEERAMIANLADRLARFDALVTFNGKSFDVPYIRERGVATGVSVEFEGAHVDLLHEARRRWRGKLPNCKLQTLERHLCKRVRTGDIPGELIPQAYHDFVRSGNAFQICDIVHHNALDLVSMSEILLHMVRECEE